MTRGNEPAGEIEPRDLQQRLARGERPLLLDVRQPWEFATARIEGAILIPLAELPGRVAELDRAQEIVTICKVGERSAAAAEFLRHEGFPRVVNLRGGILGWARDVDPSVLP